MGRVRTMTDLTTISRKLDSLPQPLKLILSFFLRLLGKIIRVLARLTGQLVAFLQAGLTTVLKLSSRASTLALKLSERGAMLRSPAVEFHAVEKHPEESFTFAAEDRALMLARILMQGARQPDACLVLELALKASSNRGEIFQNLMLLNLQHARPDRAIEILRTGLKSRGDRLNAHQDFADAAYRILHVGKMTSARAEKMCPNTPARWPALQLFDETFSSSELATELKQALDITTASESVRQWPENLSALAHLRLALLESMNGNDKAAEASLANALNIHNQLPWALFMRARQYIAKGQPDEALTLLQQATRDMPSFAAAQREAGRLSAQKGDINGALNHYFAATTGGAIAVESAL